MNILILKTLFKQFKKMILKFNQLLKVKRHHRVHNRFPSRLPKYPVPINRW